MRQVLFLSVLMVLATAAYASFDVKTGTISNERWGSGVPLGGIGCGKLEIRTDGSFGDYTGNNNWDKPTGRLKGAFMAVYAERGSKKTAKMLRLSTNEEYSGVENIAGIDYTGWFPTAGLKFNDQNLPLKVELLAWSPLVPHNTVDSALPVAAFRFKVSNPTREPAKASILFSWPNIIGVGGDNGKDDVTGNIQEPFKSGILSGLIFKKATKDTTSGENALGEYALCAAGKDVSVQTASYDASENTLSFWKSFTSTGKLIDIAPRNAKQAAGAVSASVSLKPGETRNIDFILVWHFPNHVTVYNTGIMWSDGTGPAPADLTAAFDGDKGSRWSTNRAMLPGDKIETNLGEKHRISRISLDSQGSPGDFPRGYYVEFSNDGKDWHKVVEATKDEAASQHPGAVMDIKIDPQETKYVRIVQTGSDPWNFWSIHELEFYDASGQKVPVEYTRLDAKENVGHYYSNWYHSAAQIADYVETNQDRLLSRTQEWQNLVRKSNLPDWLKLKLVNCAFSIYACGILTKDGKFAVQESPVHMGGATGTMDQRMAAHAFYTQLFPELDQSELRLFAECQDMVKPIADGRITHFDGNIHTVIGDPNVGYGVTDWPDLSCSWVMQVLKLYYWTGDWKFFDDMWPHVQRALAWLKSADEDGDNIPEGGSTYDYEGLPRGAFIYSASCYLGALRAGAEMARLMKDPVSEKLYEDQFAATQASVMKTLWNGKCFIKHYDPKAGKADPNSFIAQLAGDWLSRLSASGRTLSPEVTDSAIHEVLLRHLKPFYPVPPMEVTPAGDIYTATCYMIQHETYAGCEAINEGYVDDGLDMVKRVYDVAWDVNHNPWHENLVYGSPDGGERGLISYMTCPATWHVLNAVSGSTVSHAQKILYISPRLATYQTELHMPIFFSRVWFWMDYVPSKKLLKLKVQKTFGDIMIVERIATDSDSKPIELSKPFIAKEGAVLDLSSHISDLVLYPKSKTIAYVRPPRLGIQSGAWTSSSGQLNDPNAAMPAPIPAYDGNKSSRWTTNRGMLPGDWFSIDMDKAYKLRKVVLDTARNAQDYPKGCEVLTSMDGKSWTKVAVLSKDDCDSKVKDGMLEIEFSPVNARHIKVVQTGQDSAHWWSVDELYLYE